jgi:DNA polymerase phi
MRCMINQLSDPERYLNKAATRVTHSLVSKANSAPWMAPVAFKQLVSNNGAPNFDQLTKTKTVEKVLCAVDQSGLAYIVDELKDAILNPLKSSTDVDNPTRVSEVRRQWAADQILTLMRRNPAAKEGSLAKKYIQMLTTFAYFNVKNKTQVSIPPFSTSSQEMFRTRLMSCLTLLIASKTETATDEPGEMNWPYVAVKKIVELQAKDGYDIAIERGDIISSALNKALKAVEKLRKKRASANGAHAQKQLYSFELLYCLVILQVYNGELEDLGVLEDLQSIQDKVIGIKTECVATRNAQHEANDSSEVLMDILLSLLSKPSVLLKRLVQIIFASFCESMTATGLQICFDVLAAKEGAKGQAAVFDDADDVELIDGEEATENPDSDSDPGDSEVEIISASEADSDAEAAERNEEARKLETALQTVLGAPGDGDDGSDSDVPMDDEAMLALDEQISFVFAKRKAASNKKTQKKEAKELMVNFKSKILELFGVFVSNCPSNPLTLRIILPCLELARTTRDQMLQKKALATLRVFSRSGKHEGVPKLETMADVEYSWELLEMIHEEVGRGGTKTRIPACSSTSIFVVRTLVLNEVKNLERATAIYAATMMRWVHDVNFEAQHFFFTDFVAWAGSMRGRLGNKTEAIILEANGDADQGEKMWNGGKEQKKGKVDSDGKTMNEGKKQRKRKWDDDGDIEEADETDKKANDQIKNQKIVTETKAGKSKRSKKRNRKGKGKKHEE